MPKTKEETPAEEEKPLIVPRAVSETEMLNLIWEQVNINYKELIEIKKLAVEQ